jgi:predicted nucleic acid-binding protein
MYLVDANVLLELLYKRDRWRECYEFLNKVKAGIAKSHILHFTLHGISTILGDPKVVSKFLSEIATWRGLVIVDLPIDEEVLAGELASRVGLDFDDGLQYYYARKAKLQIVSFDRDFDKTDVKRIEPKDVQTSYSAQ